MHGHKITNQSALHFVTFTVVGWIDVFSRQQYRDIIIDSLKYCQENKGLSVNAYVLMSNHLHLIIHAKDGFQLSDIIRDFKKYTASQIIKSILQNPKESRSEWMLRLFKYFAKHNSSNITYQFWQQHNKPMELFSPKWIKQKLNYIHQNPVENGLVVKAEYYTYSSARQYFGEKGLLEIDRIDLGVIEGYIKM